MPKECKDVRAFLEIALGRPEQKIKPRRVVRIFEKKVNGQTITKFKVRTGKSLYTLKLADGLKALKLERALPVDRVDKHKIVKRKTKA